ncbi:MAG TPA: hypothetical protein VFA04_24385 [Bryobacteraceae bacterium]|nr:hypothetical protein [Bryobacteraceae bacterium]
MEANETRQEKTAAPDLRAVVRGVIDEFVEAQRQKAEPAYKAELVEQRRRREQLETRVNELIQENVKARLAAEEADRNALIRAELQRLGVSKVDLAFRAVRDDVVRGEDGRLVARGPQGEVGLKDFLTNFVNENPELLPARISGGSGMTPAQKSGPAPSGFDLDKIRPGMNPEELERVRQEISRLASQTLRGL